MEAERLNEAIHRDDVSVCVSACLHCADKDTSGRKSSVFRVGWAGQCKDSSSGASVHVYVFRC